MATICETIRKEDRARAKVITTRVSAHYANTPLLHRPFSASRLTWRAREVIDPVVEWVKCVPRFRRSAALHARRYKIGDI